MTRRRFRESVASHDHRVVVVVFVRRVFGGRVEIVGFWGGDAPRSRMDLRTKRWEKKEKEWKKMKIA